MRVLITIPMNSRVPIMPAWLDRVLSWTYASQQQVKIRLERTPNRMDWSISACVQMAKDENPDVWVRLDADTIPETPLDEALGIAFDNYKRLGFHVTAVPTIMPDGVIQAFFEPPYNDPMKEHPGEPVPVGPMEARWISGSLVFTPRKVFQAMMPVGEYVYRGGQTKHFYVKPQHPDATEDVDFCERIRQLGFKVCGDTRIHAGQHRPETSRPSLREGMHWGGSMDIKTINASNPGEEYVTP